MHTDAFKKLALLGFITMPMALGCASDRGDGDPFTSGTAGQTNTSGSDSDSATSITTTSSGTDSSSSGTDSTTDDSSTTDDTSSGGTGISFDVGDTGDATGNPTDGGTGEGCQYLDIVFIVDISGSMSEEKANLNANFPTFVQVLDDYVNDPNNGALGYRIGATNSSFQSDGSTTGLDGALYLPDGGGCGTNGSPWLDGPAAGISDNFVCLATNPKACGNSCSDLGKERPLDAMVGFADKHAPGQANEGFYRGDSSLLVIVTLTDEDDDDSVSQNSPASTKAALDAFAKGEERYVAVTVSGPEASGCNSAFGDAAPAPRLHQFTNSVPNSVMGNICDGDLTQALQEALATITASCDVLPPPQG